MTNIKRHANQIADVTGISASKVNVITQVIVDTVLRHVAKGETINISGLGQFKKVMRKGRMCRHPITRNLMQWKDTPVIKYRPANRFTKAVRK